jgi:hypothetical protein
MRPISSLSTVSKSLQQLSSALHLCLPWNTRLESAIRTRITQRTFFKKYILYSAGCGSDFPPQKLMFFSKLLVPAGLLSRALHGCSTPDRYHLSVGSLHATAEPTHLSNANARRTTNITATRGGASCAGEDEYHEELSQVHL